MTANEIAADTSLNKTRKIMLMLALGMGPNEIAPLLGVNTGFARNVRARVYGVEKPRARREKDYTFERTFGVEIEAHGIEPRRLAEELTAAGIECHAEYYNHTTRGFWKVVSDSSVHGERPFELVNPVLRGEEGLAEVTRVCAVLNRLGAKVNRTCGMRVHFGVGDLEGVARFWLNLILNYTGLEDAIDSVMPPSRRGDANQYCRSLRRDGLEARLRAARDPRQIERATTRGSRYFKVNIQSFWRHRTVEFRQHGGTTDAAKICNWVRFLSRLVEFSRHSRAVGSDFGTLRQFLPDELHAFYTARRLHLAA